jgi:hypothetical protein
VSRNPDIPATLTIGQPQRLAVPNKDAKYCIVSGQHRQRSQSCGPGPFLNRTCNGAIREQRPSRRRQRHPCLGAHDCRCVSGGVSKTTSPIREPRRRACNFWRAWWVSVNEAAERDSSPPPDPFRFFSMVAPLPPIALGATLISPIVHGVVSRRSCCPTPTQRSVKDLWPNRGGLQVGRLPLQMWRPTRSRA